MFWRLRARIFWTVLAVVFVAAIGNSIGRRLIPSPRPSTNSRHLSGASTSGQTSIAPATPTYAATPEEVERVQSVEVQSTLSPFVQLRDVQPRRSGGSVKFAGTFEVGPMSYSALKRIGALEKTVEGLRWLAKVACDRKLSEPRWAMGTQPGSWTEDEKARLKEAQALLIELGPALVSEGVLAP